MINPLSSTLRFLSIITIIGAMLALAMISGRAFMAGLPTATVTATATEQVTVATSSLPTNTPFQPDTPTPVPSPTIVPTISVIEQMIDRGELSFSGSLPIEKQIELYQVSLRFIALTPHDSLVVTRQINGTDYGDAGNTCGPLAVAIMQTAGLLDSSVIPHDFWLLNPDVTEDRAILNRTFPSDRYLDMRSKIRLNRFDWRTFPLQPGDFLYIYAGSGGNFEHMLVVNRVDQDGRAYSVTNYRTPNGYLISELLLYDPNNPGVGIFHTWTQEPEAILGSTGFGGFEIWRLRSLQ